MTARRLDRAINRAQINAPGSGAIIAQGPLPTSGSGGTNFYDAVYLAAHDKLSDEAGRKAIIVLTDAEDTGSKDEACRTRSKPRSAPIPSFTFCWSPQDGGDQNVAKKMTDETGGRMIVVRSEKNLEQAFDQISEELRSQYTIGYTPTNKAHDGTLPESQSGYEEQGLLRSHPPRLLRSKRMNLPAMALWLAAGRRPRTGLRDRVVSLARPDDQVLAIHLNANRVIFPVRRASGRAVGQRVLVAQFVPDVEKRLSQIVDAVRKERPSAGFSRQLFEHVISFALCELAIDAFRRIAFIVRS